MDSVIRLQYSQDPNKRQVRFQMTQVCLVVIFFSIQDMVWIPDTIFSHFAKTIWKPDKKSGIQKLEWYADDNYTGESDEDGARALQMVQGKMERITKWILMSGMKINVKKTEVFIFHRRNIITKDIQIMGEIITTYLCCNDLLWSY